MNLTDQNIRTFAFCLGRVLNFVCLYANIQVALYRAQNTASGNPTQSHRKNVGNQIIRKGWLLLGGGGFMKASKEYWFTLSGRFHQHNFSAME